MKKRVKDLGVAALTTILFIGCNSSNKESSPTTQDPIQAVSNVNPAKPQKGDKVPNNLVCMVNDAYMGKEQLEVRFEGKVYYGCCEMCKERIPKDESVRYAVDPQTLAKVDKANAYIVLIGEQDEIAYFENEDSYKRFIVENKTFN